MLRPAPSPTPETPGETRDAGVLVDVVVLSADLVLFEAIKRAIGERNPVWRSRSAEESVDLLLTGRCGVLLLDLAAVSTRPATLVEQIVEQFPDVVVVVAGRREDEALLAELISEGLVYRFMHKPLSAKRAGMFLQASIRAHVERRENRGSQSPQTLATVLPEQADSRKWLFVAAGVMAFVAALGLLVGDRSSPSIGVATNGRAAPDSTRAGSPAQSDPVLSRARAAYQAGRFESPAGRNALDLYAAVVLADPGQTEAREGLENTVARVMLDAKRAIESANRDEAERLLSRLQAVVPDDEATTRLAMMLAPPPPPPLPAANRPVEALASVASDAPSRPVNDQAPLRRSTPLITRQAPVPATAAPARAPPVVRPDPLAPRFRESDDLHARAVALVKSHGGRFSPGRPVPALPTAGYVRNSRPEPVAPAPPAPAAETGKVGAFVLPADEMDRVYASDPVYPASALRSGVEGWVELTFTITETGTVRDIEIVDAEPRGVFESAATQAVGNWRYRPRLANGQPVARRSHVTLRFNVDG